MPKCKKPTQGDLNVLVDQLVHPHIKRYPALILADGLLHALVEQDPETSIRKFVRYNANLVLRQLTRKRKSKKRRPKSTANKNKANFKT
jgi:hypothetical protein